MSTGIYSKKKENFISLLTVFSEVGDVYYEKYKIIHVDTNGIKLSNDEMLEYFYIEGKYFNIKINDIHEYITFVNELKKRLLYSEIKIRMKNGTNDRNQRNSTFIKHCSGMIAIFDFEMHSSLWLTERAGVSPKNIHVYSYDKYDKINQMTYTYQCLLSCILYNNKGPKIYCKLFNETRVKYDSVYYDGTQLHDLEVYKKMVRLGVKYFGYTYSTRFIKKHNKHQPTNKEIAKIIINYKLYKKFTIRGNFHCDFYKLSRFD